jgi:hypothetical protein
MRAAHRWGGGSHSDPSLPSRLEAGLSENPDVKTFSQIGPHPTLRYTGGLMRTVVASSIATVFQLALLAPAAAVPPTDLAAHCSAVHPEMQFQVRCLDFEHAAAGRVDLASAGAHREVFDRCLGASSSWSAMENCLTHYAHGEPSVRVPAASPSPSSTVDTAGPQPPAGATSTAPAEAAAAAPSPAPPGAGEASAPSTVVSPPEGPPQHERPTPPIPEADADRHLRGLLERVGMPAARCTKKQYGPGWVSICR